MPLNPMVRFGVWEDGAFIGVVIFSKGASPKLVERYGLSQLEGCELTRIALKKHSAPVSRIVSICIKQLKRANPGLRLMVSFADPRQDHVGGIYQAGNWVYCGQTMAAPVFVDRTGKEWHSRMASSSGIANVFGRRQKITKRSDCRRVVTPGKYRYLFPLDDAMRRQIEPLRQPYPKRRKVAGAGSPIQPGRCDTDPAAPPLEAGSPLPA
jgi:hypothetical protein